MKTLRLGCSLALAALCLAGCAAPEHATVPETPESPETPEPPETRVSIMTWNVENLFDTQHDAGKQDYTFLPLSEKRAHPEYLAACASIEVQRWREECQQTDWTDALLAEKLKRLSAVVRQVDNGRGPDILLLEEVENSAVLEQLNARLGPAGYSSRVLLEGWDERGIDTAVLSRLPQWGQPILHAVPYRAVGSDDPARVGKTRGILEVRLLLPGGQKASVFAVHLPSGGAPGYLREQAVAYLAELQRALPADVLPIVGGDFNINAGEEQANGYIAKGLANDWAVSQLIGCDSCKGSYYYHTKREWSFFDMLLFPPAMAGAAGFNGWQVDRASIRLVHQNPYQVNRWGTPARFDEGRQAEGVSDHWPLYGQIFTRKPGAARHD